MDASTPITHPDALPVVVIGAGPVGLAAAAHLADRGLPFVVLEAGREPGAAVLQWGHIRTFTPWRYLTDPTAEKLLAPTGWTRPGTTVPPTGAELVDHYLRPLAALLADGIRYGHRVLAVSRDGMDKSRSLGPGRAPVPRPGPRRRRRRARPAGPCGHRRLGHLGAPEPAGRLRPACGR